MTKQNRNSFRFTLLFLVLFHDIFSKTQFHMRPYNLKEESNIAIFFNTFSSNDTKHAKAIIESQLKEINSQPLLDGSPLFYTRIGNCDWKWPLPECECSNTRVCRQITAVPKGDEMLTLSALHKYCQAPKHQRHKVVYIHSKGTYTATSQNNQLRTLLMKAVLSKACLEDSSNVEAAYDGLNECDACSTRFQFLPFLCYIGNMWVAKCSYISKLLPPDQFEARKRKVLEDMKNRTQQIDQNWFETKLDNMSHGYRFNNGQSMWIERSSWIGVERYAAEHWVASHPDLQPCEVFSAATNPNIEYNRKIETQNFQPPKLCRGQETITANFSAAFWEKNGKVYHPWYSQSGRLFEYKHLYFQVPPNHSWFYKFWSGYPK